MGLSAITINEARRVSRMLLQPHQLVMRPVILPLFAFKLCQGILSLSGMSTQLCTVLRVLQHLRLLIIQRPRDDCNQ